MRHTVTGAAMTAMAGIAGASPFMAPAAHAAQPEPMLKTTSQPKPNDDTFGFLVSTPGHTPLSKVKRDIDKVISLGGSWIRIAIPAGRVVKSWGYTTSDITTLHDRYTREVEAALVYARQRDLKICIMTVNGGGIEVMPDDFYEKKIREYWELCARRFARYVSMWQVYNEPNGWHYRKFHDVAEKDIPAYLGDLAEKFQHAGELIHRENSTVMVTTNLGGWPLDQRAKSNWQQTFDVVAPHLDLLTVDLYPDLWDEAIDGMADDLLYLKNRYGKDVAVGEIGLPTQPTDGSPGGYTVAEQATAYRKYIRVLKESVSIGNFFFNLHDDVPPPGEGDPFYFGVFYADGSPKPSAQVFREELLGV